MLGAVRRALASWSRAANIKFVETSSRSQSVSPTSGGDGASLITIAGTGDEVKIKVRICLIQSRGTILQQIALVMVNGHLKSAPIPTTQYVPY